MTFVEVLEKKKNRKVPVFLKQKIVKALDILVTCRTAVGMGGENKYVFAQGDKHHMRGDHVLISQVNSCNLENPRSITSTKLRKYMTSANKTSPANTPLKGDKLRIC